MDIKPKSNFSLSTVYKEVNFYVSVIFVFY